MIATAVLASPRFGEKWLDQQQVGYTEFDEEDRLAIREFALLWAIFEAQKLMGDGRAEAMIGYVDEIACGDDDRRLLTAPFIPHLAYFRAQFVDPEQGSINDLFRSLKFANDEHRDLVSHALARLNEETPELIKALLIIVHQLKGSLFRGLKWHQCAKKQRDDLYHASKILMKATDVSIP